ncbi:hypothetical protein PDL71_15405 [Lacibacter sp. MH-610]|uniref:hypothetical protein n=1 Tax=Lacibacter sp. MH-610 TaxID=3020883 RepID=UPI003891D129
MRLILTILFLINVAFAQNPIGLSRTGYPQVVAQFNFTYTGFPSNVPDWVTMMGDPYTAVVTGNDSRSGSTITCSTVGTGSSNWNWNGISAAGWVIIDLQNSDFPIECGSGYYFNQSTTYPAGGNMRFSGLNTAGTYTLEILMVRPQVTDNRLSLIACIDNGGTETINDINVAPSTNNFGTIRNQKISTGTIYRFTGKVPNGSGEISLGIAAAPANTFGYINAVRIIRTS